MSYISDTWKSLRPDIGNLINRIDSEAAKLEAEEKRIQEKRDASYIQGAEDAKNAILELIKSESDGGMPLEEMRKCFGDGSIANIVPNTSAIDIINSVKQWKGEQEKKKQEEHKFEVGDLVLCTNAINVYFCKEFIVLSIDDNDYMNYMKLLDPKTFETFYTKKLDDYIRTGVHYDAVPISSTNKGE